MEPENTFRELKERIINDFRTMAACELKFEENNTAYFLMCLSHHEYSVIIFLKDNITKPYIQIDFRNLSYSCEIDLPSEKLAKEYVLRARKVKTLNDYVSLVEELSNQYSIDEAIQENIRGDIMAPLIKFVYEYTGEIVGENLYKPYIGNLIRMIYSNGNITLHHRITIDNDFIDNFITIYKLDRVLEYAVHKNINTVEYYDVSLETVPKVLESIIKYALRITNLNDYYRFREAVIELMELIHEEKYDIKDAIKELVEKRGYWDVFGQHLNRF